ncbi:MAG: dihydroorotate dehydrogenase [Robiginitomaculum sp.]|nr:MAG: dihydroorotate dehydrogenase [Robiginitomaculum sp.]
MDDVIYRLMDQQSWLEAKRTGMFSGSADDKRDGFIHFSTAATVRETARRYYADIPDLMLISVAVKDIEGHLKWEPSRGGVLFPHLYAPLSVSSIQTEQLLDRLENGHNFGPQIP